MITRCKRWPRSATGRPAAELSAVQAGPVAPRGTLVIGRIPDGTTALKIGDAVIATPCPSNFPRRRCNCR